MTCSRGRKQVVSERDGKLFQLFPSRVRLVGASESRLNSKGAAEQARVWLPGAVESELNTSRATEQAGVRLNGASQSWIRVWDRGARKTSAAGALPQVYIFTPRLELLVKEIFLTMTTMSRCRCGETPGPGHCQGCVCSHASGRIWSHTSHSSIKKVCHNLIFSKSKRKTMLKLPWSGLISSIHLS